MKQLTDRQHGEIWDHAANNGLTLEESARGPGPSGLGAGPRGATQGSCGRTGCPGYEIPEEAPPRPPPHRKGREQLDYEAKYLTHYDEPERKYP